MKENKKAKIEIKIEYTGDGGYSTSVNAKELTERDCAMGIGVLKDQLLKKLNDYEKAKELLRDII
jgi:hypothetical protein